jgi:hypothetical protein
MEISNSIVMTWLYNKTGASVLIAGLVYHLMLDVSATLLLDITLTGMMSGEIVPTPDFGLLWTQVVVAVIVALIFVVATKGRLGFVVKEKTESETSTLEVANP